MSGIEPLSAASRIAASGLEAQSLRLRVVAENIANAQTTGTVAGANPYARKTVSFANVLDEQSGITKVEVDRVGRDAAAFPLEFQPGHPAADARGYVKMPNVNMMVEMADMREATRSYEANLQVIRQSRDMGTMLVDLLRGGS
jgi:flagellar basal-body rod protein FlgC